MLLHVMGVAVAVNAVSVRLKIAIREFASKYELCVPATLRVSPLTQKECA